ncbi:signal transducing adapter molecule 2-like isoform X1 [Argiope bruennichi]|uniref:signal transducing adapter molecule 2-like isoform X1 n=1 Tax=Argiope bruennichi TaxID=94029 RepID=UPI0024954609|nr:signal transducing adapter molecule 2-like isoform X1 [Argiope bruennichi]
MLKLVKGSPFEEDVEKATNENNLNEDWSLIMHICDNVINYQDGAKFCLKAIMKRLHHNVPRVVLQTLTLLDACVKNCDRRFLLQVASSEFTNEVRKLLGKMHPEAEKKLKLLLQRWANEEFKDDPELGIIPSLYYKLKSEGVEFPSPEAEKKPAAPICTDPNVVTSQEEENDIIKAIEISLKDTGRYDVPSEHGTSNYGPDFSSKPLPEPIKVRAMYDFDAAEDNELTIKAGEIVMVLDNSNSSWWKGSNHRGEGLFPANFVTEDLDYKPEDTPSVTTEFVTDTALDATFVGEVKIDEAKIETLINWLNETDPASEAPDSTEMLKLEDEVHKMAPLIEDNLQSVDKRIAMLSLVNEKIMAAFDLFHSLSDNWSTLPPNMKYATMPGSQPQVSMTTMPSTAYQTMQPFPNQPMMYVPAPSSGPQYVMAGDQTAAKSVSATHTLPHPQPPLPSQVQAPMTNAPQPVAADNSGAEKSANGTNSVPTSASQVGYPPVMMNPYHPNPMGGFFVPPGMPVPFQYPPNQPNMQPQGFMPAPGVTPSVMNIPYPVQSMGPYIPFPYYYVNSNPAVTQNNIPTSVSQTPDQESVKIPSTTIASTDSSVATSASSFPSYSSDLQTMNFTTVPSSKEQNGILTDSSALSSIDSNAHPEPIQGSK